MIKAALLTHKDGPHLGAYIDGLGETPEIASLSVADASGTVEAPARQKWGSRFGAAYRDAKSLLAAEKPSLVLVAMEAALAPPVISAALDAGCHVLAEKPSCVRLSDFEPLAAKARASQRHLILALANRVDPVVAAAKRLIDEKRIGKIYGTQLHIVADQTRLTKPAYHKTWVAQKARAGGGHLIWLGIHWIDLAMYLTGSRITAVNGFTGNVGGQPIDTEDAAAVTLRFDNGTFGTMSSGYYLDAGYHSMLKFWGSDGWLEIRKHGAPEGHAPLEWYSNKDASRRVHRYEGPLEPSGYTPFVQHVVRCCAKGERPVLSTEDSLYALKAVFAAYRAAETSRTQTLLVP